MYWERVLKDKPEKLEYLIIMFGGNRLRQKVEWMLATAQRQQCVKIKNLKLKD